MAFRDLLLPRLSAASGTRIRGCFPKAVEQVMQCALFSRLQVSQFGAFLSQIGALIAGDELPRRLVVLCSVSGEERSKILLYYLRKNGYEPLTYPLPDGSPTVANVNKAVQFARRVGCEGVVGFGGGGMLNIAKVSLRP